MADNTELTEQVAALMQLSDCDVRVSVRIASREIDVVAEERTGISRKRILIECADYAKPVGIAKLQSDLGKLQAAQKDYEFSSHIMHVSRNGYTTDAHAYAVENKLDAVSFEVLVSRLMNFDGYIEAIRKDSLRVSILNEYQPTMVHTEGNSKDRDAAINYIKKWLEGDRRWLTVLGDYGVGKSWMLKRLLYDLIDEYVESPSSRPLPLFVPLQSFTKTFDFETLITATLQRSGITTVNYKAFEYLASLGRVIFLLDSFDEMAQVIRPDVIRENLATLLLGVSNGSKAILTSRPTYFESRAERLTVVEKDGDLIWEQQDRDAADRRTQLAELLTERLSTTSYARLSDLTDRQRQALFRRVLSHNPDALRQLEHLHKKFKSLESVSQRAVVARLLTSVAETLADKSKDLRIDGANLIPDDLRILNEAKIFDIVIATLLVRDRNSGGLGDGQRKQFLRAFAIRLQQPGHHLFAGPGEVREIVEGLFRSSLEKSDTPQADLENYYRTCRRHSGLTTERQFMDTSGSIDTLVDDTDHDAPIGFSHNALREFLVADSIAEYLARGIVVEGLFTARVTEAVSGFFVGLAEYNSNLVNLLSDKYANTTNGAVRQWLFRLAMGFLRIRPDAVKIFGESSAVLRDLDLAGFDLSALDLRGADFTGSLLLETDLRKADLHSTNFSDAILERVQLDDATLTKANFIRADVESLYVHDQYILDTLTVLQGRDALQWLYSSGAQVADSETLNHYLGQPWYTAAREVAVSLKTRLAGTHRKRGLVRGTQMLSRNFAEEFTDYLIKRGILEIVVKKPGREPVVRVPSRYREMIVAFADSGTIHEELEPFLGKYARDND